MMVGTVEPAVTTSHTSEAVKDIIRYIPDWPDMQIRLDRDKGG